MKSSDDLHGLRLAEQALAQPAGSLGRAGLDLTTGYGVDAFFWSPSPDRWTPDCVCRFADVLVHHDSVVYPAPDRQSLDPAALAREDPAVFAMAKSRQQPLILPYTDKTAEDERLGPTEIQTLWNQFSSWVRTGNNHRDVREWLNTNRRESYAFRKRYKVAELIARSLDLLSLEELVAFLRVPKIDVIYAFDVFARTVAYQRALGPDTIFFPHPVRAAARIRSENSFDGMSWSWGRCLVVAMQSQDIRDPSWLIDQIEAIRGASERVGEDANWYALARQPLREQAAVIREVAAEAQLPAYLTRIIHE